MAHNGQKIGFGFFTRQSLISGFDQLFFIGAHLGHVAQERDKHFCLVFIDLRKCHFDREDRSILTTGFQLHAALTDNTPVATSQHTGHSVAMGLAQMVRNDQIADRHPLDIRRQIAKHLFSSRIQSQNFTGIFGDNNPIQRGFQNALQSGIGLDDFDALTMGLAIEIEQPKTQHRHHEKHGPSQINQMCQGDGALVSILVRLTGEKGHAV